MIHGSRSRRGLAAIVVLALAGTACAKKEQPKPAAKPTPSATAPAPVLCPLTGTPVPAGLDASRPALAVKLDNAPEARPQAGLDTADIVYEELAEGGITRFMAIFHCGDAAKLGPVRSARMVDPDILVQYKPVLFAYSGANATVLGKVKSTSGVISVEHGANGAAYARQSGRPAPHNLFTSTEKLRALKKDVHGPPQTGLVFAAAAAAGASPSPAAATPSPSATASAAPGASPPAAPAPTGPGATVTFSFTGAPDHKYTYDAATGTYLRFQGINAPFQIEGAGQAKAKNLIFQKVKVQIGQLKDAAGNTSPDITVTGEGEVIVLHDGVSIKGRWSRPTLADQTKFTDANGNVINLAPGNTWIHPLPDGQAINLQ